MDVGDDRSIEYNVKCLCDGRWMMMMMMSMVTEKPLSWELSWHLNGSMAESS